MSKAVPVEFSMSDEDRRRVLPADRAAKVYTPGLPLSAQACLAAALLREGLPLVVWVGENQRGLEEFVTNAATILEGTVEICVFPPRESPGTPAHSEKAGDRLATLHRCLEARSALLVATCVQALFQKVPTPRLLSGRTRRLAVGEAAGMESVASFLTDTGFSWEAEVLRKGQAARRGSLLDVWPPTETWPIRIEFVGETVESLRAFDPVTQRSVQALSEVRLCGADELLRPDDAQGEFADFLPRDAFWIWCEPEQMVHQVELYRDLLPETDPSRRDVHFEGLRLRLERRFPRGWLAVGPDLAAEGLWDPGIRCIPGLPGVGRIGVLGPDVLEETRRRFLEELRRRAEAGERVIIYFDTPGARDRFLERHRDLPFEIRDGALTEGFEIARQRLVVLAEGEVYGHRKRLPGWYEPFSRRAGPRWAEGERLTEFADIQPGDLVVHVRHGVGKYLGLYEITTEGRRQEVLAVEYAEGAKLYVPVTQAHLLSRYVGVGRRRRELHALGGRRWLLERRAAARAATDLAASLLETQARRDALPGHAFSPDTPWQQEFEAAFPFRETPDQHRAIQEVKRDMEQPRPMDRLVCGDAGYGKTEVAMRAAFKCVQDGLQVAMLVPTTVLAQQHFDTFTERFADYPVRIEMLSRFRTEAEQRETLKRLASGETDIVIGTHRLLQPDVQFKRLGLVIIDEEQRFGVVHKEHFKRMRALVDVLTLTATPIPRTLYLSLTGARDLSTIQTPPQDRLPIETIVAQDSDELIRSAILRELNRGGQVFYLHNRVATIERVRERLARLVPEARLGVAHGQMSERRLAEIMEQFIARQIDVLICTTIIESGVDIPNVNTILIERADRFGMADLYQLRGRVGRYKHQAYAYFLLPRHGRLFDTARRRLGALRRYSALGAGFRLALRDLEIRGAGNLLGVEQSGHITNVGFELYCQLLRRAIARLKGEPLPPVINAQLKLDFLDAAFAAAGEEAVHLPADYVEDESLRLNLYRRIASAVTEEEILDLAAELKDRFGPLPPATRRLLTLARLRIAATRAGFDTVEVREGRIMLQRNGEYFMRGNRFPRLRARDPDRALDELLAFVRQSGLAHAEPIEAH